MPHHLERVAPAALAWLALALPALAAEDRMHTGDIIGMAFTIWLFGGGLGGLIVAPMGVGLLRGGPWHALLGGVLGGALGGLIGALAAAAYYVDAGMLAAGDMLGGSWFGAIPGAVLGLIWGIGAALVRRARAKAPAGAG